MARLSLKITSRINDFFCRLFKTRLYFARPASNLPAGSVVFFPVDSETLNCGLASIIIYKKEIRPENPDIATLAGLYDSVKASCLDSGKKIDSICDWYLGGEAVLGELKKTVSSFKADSVFSHIFKSTEIYGRIASFVTSFEEVIGNESAALEKIMGGLESDKVDVAFARIELVKDIAWTLKVEILDNIDRIRKLMSTIDGYPSPETIIIFRKISSVLSSIGTLEVRGRDSAGISIMLHYTPEVFKSLESQLQQLSLYDRFKSRCNQNVLLNNCISMTSRKHDDGEVIHTVVFTYKIAAEIGRLGDNVRFLRTQIKNDPVLQAALSFHPDKMSISSHTRWASVGAITEPNCHPVDNMTPPENSFKSHGIIHVCLNGDIDNYHELKDDFENQFGAIQADITTDTKIIALQIERYLSRGFDVEESFRLALNDFDGSHAITMQTDIAPGKLFLGQRGSGQAIFVGMSGDHAMATSEIYGFIEDTQNFIKLDGDSGINGEKGNPRGQIVVIDQSGPADLSSIKAFYYDGTPYDFQKVGLKHTEITSRDIDRQDFDHFFLKEISESPVSVSKTLLGKWKSVTNSDSSESLIVNLSEKIVPQNIVNSMKAGEIKRIFFIGQGTAGVAGLANAGILKHYLNSPDIQISSLKSSELSGFTFEEGDTSESMADALVIAISQSGTTTDTNRSVDMAKERGAKTIAIVNRRDSDLTFKVDGVMYTSSGRDIEMSVASTKAFYSQIVAGALISLYLAQITGKRSNDFITNEIRSLLSLPDQMRKVLGMRPEIEASAKARATTKTYWAVVGSGPNKAASDEIRIKLSELCYKTISSDYVEDKKHIDLSSEPLIIICAAGTRQSVLGDIIKDVAIFNAHKAIPIVITDEGEHRFDNYSKDIFRVPHMPEHLSPILNTLAGHIWGYYAALAINDGSRFLYRQRQILQNVLDECTKQGLSIYETVLDDRFRNQVAEFYREFMDAKKSGRYSALFNTTLSMDITLLLKYLSARLPGSDFDMDFGVRGTASNMVNLLFEKLGEAINDMARPVDAIKHQAKTVTVGTSRISEKVDGIVFDQIREFGFSISNIANRNIIVLKNLQEIIAEVKGALLYGISDLNVFGEPTENTRISPIKKTGVLASEPSRTERDSRLKGTKFIIAKEGNVFIGRGLKDGRRILVIPVLAGKAGSSGAIDHLLSLNIELKDKNDVSLHTKIKALGGKLDRIRNLVQEKGYSWDNSMLQLLDMDELYGMPAEKSIEIICQRIKSD